MLSHGFTDAVEIFLPAPSGPAHVGAEAPRVLEASSPAATNLLSPSVCTAQA